jgi:hypothetical protein
VENLRAQKSASKIASSSRDPKDIYLKMYSVFHTIRKATPVFLEHCQQLRQIQLVANGLCGKRLEELCEKFVECDDDENAMEVMTRLYLSVSFQ